MSPPELTLSLIELEFLYFTECGWTQWFRRKIILNVVQGCLETSFDETDKVFDFITTWNGLYHSFISFSSDLKINLSDVPYSWLEINLVLAK